jgi:hypothetical protein
MVENACDLELDCRRNENLRFENVENDLIAQVVTN